MNWLYPALHLDRHTFCQFLFSFGRVVDEVGALKAILMDELIVRSNERLVLIFSSMFQVLTTFRLVLMINIGNGNACVPSEFLSIFVVIMYVTI